MAKPPLAYAYPLSARQEIAESGWAVVSAGIP
jgi:hypothetical protein